jgi:hypothetical protein
MKLPQKEGLPVHLLAACFNNTVATYKFYWFLSILQIVEQGHAVIKKREIFARMLSNAWFTVNYFKISFGKSDLIQDAIRQVREIEKIGIDEKFEVITNKLVNSPDRLTDTILWHFNNNVPHWFLSPWFPGCGKREIYELSCKTESKSLYSLKSSEIAINPIWFDYLKNNAGVFKDFCLWNLAIFLQGKNPNVPDIPNKLIKPAIRNNLNKQRTQYWDIVVDEIGPIKCIYTGQDLTVGNYDVEHFIPYSFVSHDQIWNLIPSEKSFNRSKSDKLPRPERYFDSFYELHRNAINIVAEKNPKNKFLEEYLTIFPDIKSISKEKYKERVLPLITIASNNGFEYLP